MLGTRFLDAVETYFDRIIQNPSHYQQHNNKSVAVLHRFPYKIVYEVEKETLVVFAVLHTRRNPEEISKR